MGKNADTTKGVRKPTFAAGSRVFEKDASSTGLLREFVTVWWNSGKSFALSCLDARSPPHGWFSEEALHDSDVLK